MAPQHGIMGVMGDHSSKTKVISYCEMGKMKIRMVFLTLLTLTTTYFFIARSIQNQPVNHHVVQESPPPQQRSVTLEDGTFIYHLNFSQFLLELPYLQNYSCSLLLAPPEESSDHFMIPFLLLAIKSHPESTARRKALRQTWAKEVVTEGYRVRPVFLMAQSDRKGVMDIVRRESEAYNDILQWDFTEAHSNLSLKDRCFLQWLHFNLSYVDFIFKGDDDVFVNPAALVRYIKEHGTPYVLHGAVQHHAAVQRSSKYQVSWSLFPNNYYPYFLSGGGYLFPGPSVRRLYWASQTLPVFPLDDVYFGFLVLAAKLSFRDEKRFYVWGLQFTECNFQQALVVHRVDPDDLIRIWTKVQEAVCKNEDVTQNI